MKYMIDILVPYLTQLPVFHLAGWCFSCNNLLSEAKGRFNAGTNRSRIVFRTFGNAQDNEYMATAHHA